MADRGHPKQNTQTKGPAKKAKAVAPAVPHVPRLVVPRDEEDDRYVQSFTVDQPDQILQFFAEYGFVVVRDVISREDADKSVDELWSFLEAEGKMNRNKPETWGNWPSTGIVQYGQPSRPPIFKAQFMCNRQSPRIHRVFALLFGQEELLMNIDRGCVFRPTKAITFPTGVSDMPDWGTRPNLHLDMNPWQWLADDDKSSTELEKLTYEKYGQFIQENNQVDRKDGLTLQAALNLLDNHDEDGGFQCVPGFHKVFESYFTAVPGTKEAVSYNFAPKDPINKAGVRISMRQGSIVVWDQRMPHGSLPNNGSRFRCAQFMRMFPTSKVGPARLRARANALVDEINRLNGALVLTDLGRRVFGVAHASRPLRAIQPTTASATSATSPDSRDSDKSDRQPPNRGGGGRVQGSWGPR